MTVSEILSPLLSRWHAVYTVRSSLGACGYAPAAVAAWVLGASAMVEPLIKPSCGQGRMPHSLPTPSLVLLFLLKDFWVLKHNQWLKASFHDLGAFVLCGSLNVCHTVMAFSHC